MMVEGRRQTPEADTDTQTAFVTVRALLQRIRALPAELIHSRNIQLILLACMFVLSGCAPVAIDSGSQQGAKPSAILQYATAVPPQGIHLDQKPAVVPTVTLESLEARGYACINVITPEGINLRSVPNLSDDNKLDYGLTNGLHRLVIIEQFQHLGMNWILAEDPKTGESFYFALGGADGAHTYAVLNNCPKVEN